MMPRPLSHFTMSEPPPLNAEAAVAAARADDDDRRRRLEIRRRADDECRLRDLFYRELRFPFRDDYRFVADRANFVRRLSLARDRTSRVVGPSNFTSAASPGSVRELFGRCDCRRRTAADRLPGSDTGSVSHTALFLDFHDRRLARQGFDAEFDRAARFGRLACRELVGVFDRDVVDVRDQHAAANAGVPGRGIRIDVDDQHARGREPQALIELRVELGMGRREIDCMPRQIGSGAVMMFLPRTSYFASVTGIGTSRAVAFDGDDRRLAGRLLADLQHQAVDVVDRLAGDLRDDVAREDAGSFGGGTVRERCRCARRACRRARSAGLSGGAETPSRP